MQFEHGSGFASKVAGMTLAVGKHVNRARRFGIRLKRNDDGATAVEFGLIALPFFAMLFGVLSVCQLFFWTFTMENAVWTASRDMRTGTFQTAASGSPYAGLTGDALKTAFRQQICNKSVNATDCFNNSVVYRPFAPLPLWSLHTTGRSRFILLV